MLHAKFFEEFIGRLGAPGTHIFIGFRYVVDGFVIILRFLFQRGGQTSSSAATGVLSAPLRVVVQLGLAFRREMDFHAQW